MHAAPATQPRRRRTRAPRRPWAAIGRRATPPPCRAHTLTGVKVVTPSRRYCDYKSTGARRPRARDVDASAAAVHLEGAR
jgi:hypothetical protein